MQISKGNQIIRSMEEWFKYASPQKGINQWKNSRSAKELSRAWLPDTVPMPGDVTRIPFELQQLLETNGIGDFSLEHGEPEFESAFDANAGMVANLDLFIAGKWRSLNTVFGIEAKADEAFGPLIRDHYQKNPEPSRLQPRIDNLCNVFFGKSFKENLDQLGSVRYQLLTGLAGTLAEAQRRNAQQAVFIVHFFDSNTLLPDKVSANQNDYRDFLALLVANTDLILPETDLTGMICGPLAVRTPTDLIPEIPFYIGKCTRNLSPLLDFFDAWALRH